MAKWAIGLRLPGTTDLGIEEDFNKGAFLRTHMMRPTWHFVSPEDIRWIQSLTSPTVHSFNAYYYNRSGLDAELLSRSIKILHRMLEGKNFQTRKSIQVLLGKNKINATGERLTLILMFAELEALICSGPRMGKQFTYALLEERSHKSKALFPADPLGELARRYFTTRGPATAQDFMWWSGLKAKQVKEGMESLPGDFKKEVINGQEYILLPLGRKSSGKIQSSFLLPDYDEYGISYKNRDAYAQNDEESMRSLDPTFRHYLVINGRIGGKWKKIEFKGVRRAEACCMPGLGSRQEAAAGVAVKMYNSFHKT